jgi:ferredoxin
MPGYVPALTVTGDCHGCGVCVPACRRGAIRMTSRDESGAPTARIDAALCNLCRKCQDVCPTESIGEPYPPVWREDRCGD